MTLLFKNVHLPEACGFSAELVNVAIKDQFIEYIGKELPEGEFDRTVDGRGDLLMPAFYNTHCHSAMTIFRGFGDDLPLREWLDTKILPAEELLNDNNVYYGSMLGIAEMIKNGVVSFSDMYFFLDSTARAVGESGIKANISRSIVSFDPDMDLSRDHRIAEGESAVRSYNGAFDGRLKVDMSIHAEYSNVERCCRRVGEIARELGVGMQIHLSETKSEHENCIRSRGMTPTEFFAHTGVLDVPTTAAHCVWVSDSDIEILAQKGVSVAHNPVSNLKLASGIMPYNKMKDAGVNITLGTDGVASNNQLSVLRELQFAALIHKGNTYNAKATSARDIICCATAGGARAQGREDCGRLEVGCRADIILLDMSAINCIPTYDYESTVCYAANDSNVRMTVCDGRILYENGEYTTIDIERLKYEAKEVIAHYFD